MIRSMVNIQGPGTFYKVPGLPLCKQLAIYNFSYKSKIALMEIVSIKEGIQRTNAFTFKLNLIKWFLKLFCYEILDSDILISYIFQEGLEFYPYNNIVSLMGGIENKAMQLTADSWRPSLHLIENLIEKNVKMHFYDNKKASV